MSDGVRSVLVVDDDGDNRHALAELLREGRRRVTTARDRVEAFEKLASLERPALILLDLMMPRMDGLEFLRHLCRHESADEFPLFVMSADDGLRRIARGHPRVRGAFRKPLDVDDLLSAMAEQR
jgi:CheY-like chemotaxis protein